MKKRVTILLPTFSTGGAEHMVYELAKNIDANQFEVSILCYMGKQDTPLTRMMEECFPVTYLNQSGRISPRAVWRVIWAIKETKPDVVHAHLGGVAFGAIWAMLFRKPLVVTVHTKPEKAFTKNIEILLHAAIKAGRTKVVAVSAENEGLVKKHYGLDDSGCTCVNNGIALERFGRQKHAGFTLINVARQDDNKNQAALVRCFARLHEENPATRLLLLGNGVNHEMLKQLAIDLNIADAVTFTGNVANTEEYYAVSDLYVQTSFREAMPLSVLEAMAAGLPIVSTDVGGLRDIVLDNGLLVPAGDEDALYRAICKIYHSDQDQKDAMSGASLQIVQEYSSENMARAYERIYNDMCK